MLFGLLNYNNFSHKILITNLLKRLVKEIKEIVQLINSIIIVGLKEQKGMYVKIFHFNF